MRTIKVPCSSAGMLEAADWLDNYAKRILPMNVVDLISRMTRTGETWAMTMMNHIDTGATLSTIHGYRSGNKGVIVAGGAAIWIEFGTGVFAEGQNNHPLLGKVPGIVPHGTYGEGHGASPNGWYYPDPNGTHVYNGQTYSHTMGIPANRFMYRTAEMLRREYPEMAKEIFSK